VVAAFGLVVLGFVAFDVARFGFAAIGFAVPARAGTGFFSAAGRAVLRGLVEALAREVALRAGFDAFLLAAMKSASIQMYHGRQE
jgi:hypothetical protein